MAKVGEALAAVPNHGLDFGVLRYLATNRLCGASTSEMLVLFLGAIGENASEHELFHIAPEPPGFTQNAAELRPYVLEIIARILDGRLIVSVSSSSGVHRYETLERLLEGFRHAYLALRPIRAI
jgi:non-ribosomal peptide synthase protein (TIGR01720 family)